MAKAVITSGIGYSPLTETVYMGRQNQQKRMWVGEKKDITNQFLDCAFQYFEENTVRTIVVSKKKHLFIHVAKDKESIEKVIKKLRSLIK